MKADKPTTATAAELRRFAEEQLQGQLRPELQDDVLHVARRVGKDSLDQYTELYDFGSVAYFTLRRDGGIVRTNLAGAHLLGRERDRLTDMDLGSFLTDVTFPAFDALLLQVFVDRTPQRCEAALMREDQSIRIVQIEAILSADKQECHLVVVDITERKRAEETLRNSERKFRAVIESSPIPLALNDDGQNITLLNPAFIAAFGYTLEEIPTLAQWWLKAYPNPEYRDWVATSWQSRLETAKRGGTDFEPLELNIQSKQGAVVTVLASAAQLQGAFQETHLVVLYDITEQKESQRALSRAHEFSLGTIDALSAHLCVLDSSGVIIAVNRAWAEFYEHNRLPNQPVQDFVGIDYFSACRSTVDDSGPDAQQISDGIQQVLSGERSEFSLEYPCHSPTEQRWFLARVTRFRRDDGNHVVVAHENITERKRSEELLRQNADRTRRILRAAAVGLWEWDLVTDEVYFSPEWKQQFGYADDEVSDRFDEWQKRVHPDDVERALAAARDFRDGRVPNYAVEIRMLHRDGSWRWIYGEGDLEHSENGEPVIMRGSQIDITERVRSAQVQTALFNISVASQECSDLDDLYRRVHVIVSGLMPARNFYIAMLDEANDQVRFDYWVDEIEASSAPLRFSDGVGLTDRVLRSGQPLLVYPQSSQEGKFPTGLTIIGPQGVDWLGVPLKVRDKTIGVLAVQNYTGDARYQQHHLELLQFVSDQIGSAVDRKRAEQRQRDSDQRFRDLVDSTDGIVWQADASTFVFDYVSSNAERLLGYPLTDWLEPGFWADHIHPEDRSHALQFCASCTGRLEDHEFEYRFLTHSGAEVWLRDIVKVVAEDDKPRWLRGLMLDITSMKHAQKSLEQAANSLAQTQHLLEASQYAAQVGGWELDVASGDLFWTSETYRIHDLTPDEHTPDVGTAINFYTPESVQLLTAALQLAKEEGTSYDLELELTSAKGRHIWVRTTGIATRVRDRTIKVGGAVQDITERKRAEQWQEHYSRVLAMVSAESSLPFVLEELAQFVERQSRGSSCSILLLSNDGLHLNLGAAPSLPDYFIHALEGTPIGEKGGACGTAALEGAPVLVDDFHESDGSVYWLELANRAGLRSCWSRPIFSAEHKVMGTFAIYHGEPWSPTPVDEELLRRSASLAALAIDRSRHQEAQRLAKTVFEENAEGVMVTSPDDRILMVNPAFERLTGYSAEEVVGQAPALLDSSRHDGSFWAAVHVQLAQTGRWEGEVWHRRKNGETYPVQMAIADVRDAAGRRTHCITRMADLSLQRVQASRIEQLAFYDDLTGLPNRALFLDRLENILASAERQGSRGALLFMDLDHFKEINDSKGHAVGDLALAETARRFLSACRREETLARLGGDEFVLIAEGADHHSAALVANRLLHSLSEPLMLLGTAHSIGISIGIALFPDDGTTTEELIKHTDIAMYRAKASGGGYRFYQADMSTEFEKHLGIAQRLGAAMQADQLQLYYQPKIELATGKLAGAEALLRWHDAELGWISPAEFIPIAEQRGMMGKLGDWVLRRACVQLSEWRNRGIELPGRLSVNVSARQLEDPEIVGRMLEIVHDAGGTPGWLELELTESSMMLDPEQSIQILEYFAAAGFGLSIDDFGTGYSSLAYLKRFAADEIKIDISFVRNMLTDADDYAIVSTIIGMAHGFGMTTAAEGVELEGQAEALKALRCDTAQGYLYSRPEAPDVFAGKWLGPDRA